MGVAALSVASPVIPQGIEANATAAAEAALPEAPAQDAGAGVAAAPARGALAARGNLLSRDAVLPAHIALQLKQQPVNDARPERVQSRQNRASGQGDGGEQGANAHGQEADAGAEQGTFEPRPFPSLQPARGRLREADARQSPGADPRAPENDPPARTAQRLAAKEPGDGSQRPAIQALHQEAIAAPKNPHALPASTDPAARTVRGAPSHPSLLGNRSAGDAPGLIRPGTTQALPPSSTPRPMESPSAPAQETTAEPTGSRGALGGEVVAPDKKTIEAGPQTIVSRSAPDGKTATEPTGIGKRIGSGRDKIPDFLAPDAAPPRLVRGQPGGKHEDASSAPTPTTLATQDAPAPHAGVNAENVLTIPAQAWGRGRERAATLQPLPTARAPGGGVRLAAPPNPQPAPLAPRSPTRSEAFTPHGATDEEAAADAAIDRNIAPATAPAMPQKIGAEYVYANERGQLAPGSLPSRDARGQEGADGPRNLHAGSGQDTGGADFPPGAQGPGIGGPPRVRGGNHDLPQAVRDIMGQLESVLTSHARNFSPGASEGKRVVGTVPENHADQISGKPTETAARTLRDQNNEPAFPHDDLGARGAEQIVRIFNGPAERKGLFARIFNGSADKKGLFADPRQRAQELQGVANSLSKLASRGDFIPKDMDRRVAQLAQTSSTEHGLFVHDVLSKATPQVQGMFYQSAKDYALKHAVMPEGQAMAALAMQALSHAPDSYSMPQLENLENSGRLETLVRAAMQGEAAHAARYGEHDSLPSPTGAGGPAVGQNPPPHGLETLMAKAANRSEDLPAHLFKAAINTLHTEGADSAVGHFYGQSTAMKNALALAFKSGYTRIVSPAVCGTERGDLKMQDFRTFFGLIYSHPASDHAGETFNLISQKVQDYLDGAKSNPYQPGGRVLGQMARCMCLGIEDSIESFAQSFNHNPLQVGDGIVMPANNYIASMASMLGAPAGFSVVVASQIMVDIVDKYLNSQRHDRPRDKIYKELDNSVRGIDPLIDEFHRILVLPNGKTSPAYQDITGFGWHLPNDVTHPWHP